MADTAPRGWFPAYTASIVENGEQMSRMIADEILQRSVAGSTVEDLVEAMGDRMGEALDDYLQVARAVERARISTFLDYGDPRASGTPEEYLEEMADRAGVVLIEGHVAADGFFYRAETKVAS